LRAKADLLAARATAARLENELAAVRSRSWWRWLGRRKRHQTADFVVQQTHTNVQTIFASSAAGSL
jgi:hypothetical protein